MRDSSRALLFLVAPALLAPLLSPAAAQDGGIEDQIRSLGADNGRLYGRPVTSGLGAGLVAGWFHDARSLGPLSVEVGVRGVGAFVPDEDESFEPVLPSEISVDELGGRTFSEPYGTGDGLETPTAAGEGAGVVVPPEGEFRQALIDAGLPPADFAIRFPRGFDLPAVPVGALQLNLGVAPGVDVSGRLVPEIEIDEEVGSVQSVGGAVKLSVTDWMYVSPPVDVAVAAGIQTVDVGDYLSTDTRHASLMVSRNISALTIFASGTLEDSDSEVEYTVESEVLPEGGTTITFEDDGANSGRFTAGFSLDLLFLQLKADYSVGTYETVSAGVGVRF
jgi:hypothetical protein